MRVELGSVDAPSGRAFVAYGRYVLEAPPGQALAWDVRSLFVWYLDQWSAAARSGDVMHWSQEIACDEVQYLLHAFHRLALEVEACVVDGRLHPYPTEAAAFYHVLVRAMLEAVATESEACAAWAEDLGSFWPGIDPVERWPHPAARP